MKSTQMKPQPRLLLSIVYVVGRDGSTFSSNSRRRSIYIDSGYYCNPERFRVDADPIEHQ